MRRGIKWMLMLQVCMVILYLVYLNQSATYLIFNRRPTSNYTVNLNKVQHNVVSTTHHFMENAKHMLENITITVENTSCPNRDFPRKLVSDSSWVSVNGKRLAFVYSAYHVTNKVVIIGAKTAALRTVICQIWYQTQNKEVLRMKEVTASARALPESHGKRYYAALFECNADTDHVPRYVSIVTSSCDVTENLIIVRPASTPPSYKRNFTVCLPPLNLKYSRAFELIEWIELNSILGADKFIVYNHSIADNVAQVLNFYSRKGLVEVLPWNLPMGAPMFRDKKVDSEIHYFGQVVALNECLYRNKDTSEFVVNLDLDEFIIPHAVETWREVIDKAKTSKDAYIFKNTFFKKEWVPKINSTVTWNIALADKYKLVTLQKIQHERKIFLPKMRSKYIARTSKVSQLMIHDVPRVAAENVHENLALLHHYRFWGNNIDPDHIKVYDDTVPVKYGNELISRVEQAWQQLKHVQMSMETEPPMNTTK